jgi:hypothetical protein
MNQTFLLLLCVCVGFIAGYGVRALISEYRRREARKEREAREARLQRLRQSLDHPGNRSA